MLDFIGKAFPNARFVINYRMNLTAQADSAWFKNSNDSQELLENETQNLLNWATANSNRTFLLPLEQFSTELFNELFIWLGYSQCTATTVPTENAKSSYSAELLDKEDPVICH